jgi:hypothetical protein
MLFRRGFYGEMLQVLRSTLRRASPSSQV